MYSVVHVYIDLYMHRLVNIHILAYYTTMYTYTTMYGTLFTIILIAYTYLHVMPA